MSVTPGAPSGATHAAALLPAEAFESLETHARAHAALGRRVSFEGEVTDVRSRELLVAAGDWSFAVRVTLPAAGGLRFGDWVRVQGRLVLRSSPREASLQLFLVDAGVERLGRSRRSESLQATLRRFARSADESRRLDWVAHVAVVGTQGHGLRDVIATLERAGLTYTLYEADFSDGVSIAAAIRRASDDGRVATLVTRGGGSRMELEPVNSVDVAAAARNSKAFTVLAIGHQSDVFDVECAFDRTFGTPSKGAGFLASLGRNPLPTAAPTRIPRPRRMHACRQRRSVGRAAHGGEAHSSGARLDLGSLGSGSTKATCEASRGASAPARRPAPPARAQPRRNPPTPLVVSPRSRRSPHEASSRSPRRDGSDRSPC